MITTKVQLKLQYNPIIIPQNLYIWSVDQEFSPKVNKMRRRTLTDTLNKERKRKFVPCHCNDCKGKLVDPHTMESHQEISSQIPMNTSQEVYEDIDTESSHSSALTEVSMQDIERSVDVEENQNIMDNSHDEIDFNFLPRECTSRYTKVLANFDINNFVQSESEQSVDDFNDDDNDDSANNEQYEIFEDYSCPPLPPLESF